jgi:radical SAM/Cys-rich protein
LKCKEVSVLDKTNKACECVEGLPPFIDRIPVEHQMTRPCLHTMQINVGKLCNLACKHCHIEAGPNRTEIMSREVLEECLIVLDAHPFDTVDITGGAPEMNPYFEWFIGELAQRDLNVIVRSNLVVLTLPEYGHLATLYARYRVNVVSSLPAYTEREADSQRGAGSFEACIAMLKKLNSLGYGIDERLQLDLVYNPRGAFMPASQEALAAEFHEKLGSAYGIVFNNLLTITNNPIGRFGAWLERSGNMDGYMHKLADAFNPATTQDMMCRGQISVEWTGRVFDCDFNQICDLPSTGIYGISDLRSGAIASRPIHFGQHCYACTAGAGSSCGGATA